jgi:protein ImuB
MRWACIFFPQFALDGVLRDCPDPDEPLVLLHRPIQRRIIKAANPAALALGPPAGDDVGQNLKDRKNDHA